MNRTILFYVAILIATFNLSFSQDSAEEKIRELYDKISFQAGEKVDWEEVKEIFTPEAILVLRTSYTKFQAIDRDGFVQLFLDDIDKHKLLETGFIERITAIKVKEMGDIAHGWVLYEAMIPGREKPANRGVDSIELVRIDGNWFIAGITNEVEMKDRPINMNLFK